jgi:hypothetical protein
MDGPPRVPKRDFQTKSEIPGPNSLRSFHRYLRIGTYLIELGLQEYLRKKVFFSNHTTEEEKNNFLRETSSLHQQDLSVQWGNHKYLSTKKIDVAIPDPYNFLSEACIVERIQIRNIGYRRKLKCSKLVLETPYKYDLRQYKIRQQQ